MKFLQKYYIIILNLFNILHNIYEVNEKSDL